MAKSVSTQINQQIEAGQYNDGVDKVFIVNATYRKDLDDIVILDVKFVEKDNLEKKIIFPRNDLLKCLNAPNATDEELMSFCLKLKGKTINMIFDNVKEENINPNINKDNVDEKIEQSDSSVLNAAYNLAQEKKK